MDKLSALWQGASYQDKLLQAYRGYQFVTQFILIAIGTGISVAILTFHDPLKILTSYGLLTVFTVSALYFLLALKRLINARAEDVDYFQQRILECEHALPKDEQVLTAFKVHQKYGRKIENAAEHFSSFILDDSTRKTLVEKNKGRTRKLLDQSLVYVIICIWILLHVVSVIGIFI